MFATSGKVYRMKDGTWRITIGKKALKKVEVALKISSDELFERVRDKEVNILITTKELHYDLYRFNATLIEGLVSYLKEKMKEEKDEERILLLQDGIIFLTSILTYCKPARYNDYIHCLNIKGIVRKKHHVFPPPF